MSGDSRRRSRRCFWVAKPLRWACGTEWCSFATGVMAGMPVFGRATRLGVARDRDSREFAPLTLLLVSNGSAQLHLDGSRWQQQQQPTDCAGVVPRCRSDFSLNTVKQSSDYDQEVAAADASRIIPHAKEAWL